MRKWQNISPSTTSWWTRCGAGHPPGPACESTCGMYRKRYARHRRRPTLTMIQPGSGATNAHQCINHKDTARRAATNSFDGGHSPPPRGGVDATSRRYREASFEERTAGGARASPIGRSHQEKTSLTSHISECVLNTACERPPRLRRFGGFATSS